MASDLAMPYGRLGVKELVWVGSTDGQIYEINAATGAITASVLMGGGTSVRRALSTLRTASCT
jgi:hypothetical protein